MVRALREPPLVEERQADAGDGEMAVVPPQVGDRIVDRHDHDPAGVALDATAGEVLRQDDLRGECARPAGAGGCAQGRVQLRRGRIGLEPRAEGATASEGDPEDLHRPVDGGQADGIDPRDQIDGHWKGAHHAPCAFAILENQRRCDRLAIHLQLHVGVPSILVEVVGGKLDRCALGAIQLPFDPRPGVLLQQQATRGLRSRERAPVREAGRILGLEKLVWHAGPFVNSLTLNGSGPGVFEACSCAEKRQGRCLMAEGVPITHVPSV
mmetsp:Transcript_83578/g.147279  ORF Transcript_83578/g.147279 Transcript_83578/m.147279 type:complete len:267 (-) Transcript_83578:2637-3437(-)